MKAYQSDWLDALDIKELANRWRKKLWLSEEQYQVIDARYPSAFYTPNIFIRIGLFVFTVFLTSCALGLTSLLFLPLLESSDIESVVGVISILYGVGTLMALEYFIRTKHHYRSGIDDSLLYFTLALVIGGLGLLFSPVLKESLVGYALLPLPVLVVAAMRYADRLVAIAAYLCFLAVIFLLCIEFSWGRLLVSFLIMLVSAAVYFRAHKQKEQNNQRYWAKCLLIVEMLALLTFYLSGNYFVVREGNALLNENNYREFESPQIKALIDKQDALYVEIQELEDKNANYPADTVHLPEYETEITANSDKVSKLYDQREELQNQINDLRIAEREKQAASGVPFAWIFYAFTFLVPLTYLILALRRRDRPMLWLGMLCTLLAVMTYKFYYSVAPVGVTLTLSGSLLIFLAYFSIRFLKTPKAETRYKLTYQDVEDEDGPLNAEALLIAQTFGKTSAQPEPGLEFGGGDFGGGGAGNGY